MVTKFDPRTKSMGFGFTEEEAEEELLVHNARQNIDLDTSGYYKKRRDELFSWLPLPNLFSIKSLCSITYQDGYMMNTSTGLKIAVEEKPLAHYLYLFYLIGGKVTYSDFTVTMAKEVNQFFANISDKFGTLDEFPYTKPGQLTDAVDMHYLCCGGFVCRTKVKSILVCNDKQILSVDLIDGIDTDCLIAYGLAKLNIVYNGVEAFRY